MNNECSEPQTTRLFAIVDNCTNDILVTGESQDDVLAKFTAMPDHDLEAVSIVDGPYEGSLATLSDLETLVRERWNAEHNAMVQAAIEERYDDQKLHNAKFSAFDEVMNWLPVLDDRSTVAPSDRLPKPLDDMMPILDILPRLWLQGWKTEVQDKRWYLFDNQGNGITSGSTFRDLCVNIVLSGL